MKKTILLCLAIFIFALTSCENTTPNDCIDTSKIVENPNCPQHEAPVCGCDGKTYYNSCYAKAAGVTSYAEGKCK